MDNTENTTAEPKPKRRYQRSSAERAKIAARRQAKQAKKDAEKARVQYNKVQRKVKKAKEAATTAKEIAKKLDGKHSDVDGTIVTGEQIAVASPAIKRIAREDEERVIFRPNEGPQTEFLAAPEKEVLYGGAAGGGKSYAMLIDLLRYAHNGDHRALLLRRTMPELMELIDKSRQLYPKAFPKAKFREVEKRWIFPSGATALFSFVDIDQDVTRYQGQAFSWIGIDEITHYPTPYVWNYLRSRLRTTSQDIVPYMRCTANPGGVGGIWVRKMFVDPAPAGKPFWATDLETGRILRYPDIEAVDPKFRGKPLFRRRFIPAKLTDNKYLMESPDYMAMLSSLPETERRRLLEGDWNVSDDCAFPEFRTSLHVVEDFEIPPDWHRFRACDYGYVAPTAVLWFAVSPKGTIYVYRELYAKGLNAETLADKILEIEVNDPMGMSGVLDNECWARRGQVGPTIAQVMIRAGVKWRPADKGPGSRINGKMEVHRKLAVNPYTQQPDLQIFNSCRNLIRVMPMLPLNRPDKSGDPEDVDTDFAEDHLYDALRYGIASRMVKMNKHPVATHFDTFLHVPQVHDPIFGY